MNGKCHMKTLSLGLPLAIGWFFFAALTFAQFRDPIGPYPAPQADPSSTDAMGTDPSEIQSRGVPSAPQGVIIQGNQLKAAPGYVLEKGPNKQMTARPRAGGGRSLTLDCGCQGGTGNCGLDVSGDVAICHRDSVQPCSGTCGWSSLPSKVGPPGMR